MSSPPPRARRPDRECLNQSRARARAEAQPGPTRSGTWSRSPTTFPSRTATAEKIDDEELSATSPGRSLPRLRDDLDDLGDLERSSWRLEGQSGPDDDRARAHTGTGSRTRSTTRMRTCRWSGRRRRVLTGEAGRRLGGSRGGPSANWFASPRVPRAETAEEAEDDEEENDAVDDDNEKRQGFDDDERRRRRQRNASRLRPLGTRPFSTGRARALASLSGAVQPGVTRAPARAPTPWTSPRMTRPTTTTPTRCVPGPPTSTPPASLPRRRRGLAAGRALAESRPPRRRGCRGEEIGELRRRVEELEETERELSKARFLAGGDADARVDAERQADAAEARLRTAEDRRQSRVNGCAGGVEGERASRGRREAESRANRRSRGERAKAEAEALKRRR